jgi:hypothetical protein
MANAEIPAVAGEITTDTPLRLEAHDQDCLSPGCCFAVFLEAFEQGVDIYA